jgi:hypothetical protein
MLVDVDQVRLVPTALDADLSPTSHEIDVSSPSPPS